MTPMEQHVWAAVFAAAFHEEVRFRKTHGLGGKLSDGHGFSCAEQADEAVEALRATLDCDDASYLLPVEEGWTWTQPTGV